MLEQKSNYKVNEPVVIRLITGEEIIAKLVSEDDAKFLVSKPRLIVPQGEGVGIGFMSVVMDPQALNIPIFKGTVVSAWLPPKELVDGYIKFTSNIQIANNIPDFGNLPKG